MRVYKNILHFVHFICAFTWWTFVQYCYKSITQIGVNVTFVSFTPAYPKHFLRLLFNKWHSGVLREMFLTLFPFFSKRQTLPLAEKAAGPSMRRKYPESFSFQSTTRWEDPIGFVPFS